MWTLSGFADEISPDLEEQCEVAKELGLRYIEVRSAWGVNILDLDDEQLGTMKGILDRHGLKTSSIGSPIGKIHIDDEFPPHLERMRHAAEVGHFLGPPYIRVFSFFQAPGSDPDQTRACGIGTMG